MTRAQTWRDQEERRFHLPRRTAEEVLATLDEHLPAVVYTPGSVTTLVATTYLDTPGGRYYRAARAAGGARSLKLRIREYFPLGADERRAILARRDHCYLERKQREGDVRLKQRVTVAKNLVTAIVERRAQLEGAGPEAEALRHELATQSLVPVLVSVYERRVWGSDSGTDLRITFDERLRFYVPPPHLYDELDALDPAELGAPVGIGPKRILELKHARGAALPAWLETLTAPLPGSGAYSKFVDGMGQRRQSPRFLPALTEPVIAIKRGG